MTIACTSWARQKSVSSPENDSTRTLSKPAQACSSIAIRSSAENIRLLDGFTPTAITTSSNSFDARPTMSRWPSVTGSNDPGQTARCTLAGS